MDNKSKHDAARENVIEFAGELIHALSKVDPGVDPKLDPKKCVMRIYRDIRFSPDKTPYKNNFGIGRLRSGTKTEGVGYFFHIQPGESFFAGGYWQPPGDHLKAIRQEIDYNGAALKKIVDAKDFIESFGAFRDQEQLKTVPREYSADHENMDLLKLKSFVAIHQFDDDDLLKEDIVEKTAALAGKIYPLNVFLNNAIA